jgi:hypothetical protein
VDEASRGEDLLEVEQLAERLQDLRELLAEHDEERADRPGDVLQIADDLAEDLADLV